MWVSVLSGVFSGIIGALLGIYTSNKADIRQEESIKMDAAKDLIYKNQIEWYNDLRKSIATLIEYFIKTNDILDKIDRLGEKVNEINPATAPSELLTELQRILVDLDDTRKQFKEIFAKTQGQMVLVRLYLFNLEDSNETDILKEINRLINSYYNKKHKIPLEEMDILIERVRILLKKQQEKLEKKFE